MKQRSFSPRVVFRCRTVPLCTALVIRLHRCSRRRISAAAGQLLVASLLPYREFLPKLLQGSRLHTKASNPPRTLHMHVVGRKDARLVSVESKQKYSMDLPLGERRSSCRSCCLGSTEDLFLLVPPSPSVTVVLRTFVPLLLSQLDIEKSVLQEPETA